MCHVTFKRFLALTDKYEYEIEHLLEKVQPTISVDLMPTTQSLNAVRYNNDDNDLDLI